MFNLLHFPVCVTSTVKKIVRTNVLMICCVTGQHTALTGNHLAIKRAGKTLTVCAAEPVEPCIVGPQQSDRYSY